MDGPLKEGNNWRSQSQTSHKPTRPMSKRLDSRSKELQGVERSLEGAMEWALSAGTWRKSKGELSHQTWAEQLHGFGKRLEKGGEEPGNWAAKENVKKCRNRSRGNQKSREVTWWEDETEGRTLIVTPDYRGRTKSGGGLLFSFFHWDSPFPWPADWS